MRGDGLCTELTLPPRESLLLFESGKSKEGYFNTDRFVRSQFAALILFEFRKSVYPDAVSEVAAYVRQRHNSPRSTTNFGQNAGRRVFHTGGH